MSRFNAYSIDRNFTIAVVPPIRRLSDDMKLVIEQQWQKAVADNPDLFNGKLLSFRDFDGSRLIADFADYKEYLAQLAIPELKEWLGIRPVAVSGITMAADHVLIGQRAACVSTNPLAYELAPSGTIDNEALEGSKMNVLASFIKEIVEETAIDTTHIVRIDPFLVVNDTAGSWEVVAKITVRDEVVNDFDFPIGEYKDLFWLPRKNIPLFLAGREDEFVPFSLFLLNYVQ